MSVFLLFCFDYLLFCLHSQVDESVVDACQNMLPLRLVQNQIIPLDYSKVKGMSENGLLY